MRSGLGCLWLCGAVLTAADDVRSTPLDVYTMPFNDGATRLVVDWGSQGDSFERKPQSVVDEHRQLLAWLKSPEVVNRLKQYQADFMKKEHALGLQEAAAWKEKFETQGQKVALGVRSTLAQRRIPLPPWMTGLPGEMRPLVQVGIFDASDKSQIRWAVAQRTLRPEMHLFAVGWESMRQFHELALQHPTLSATTVNSVAGGASAEDWIAHYGVSALPAFCRIDGSELVIEEGGIP